MGELGGREGRDSCKMVPVSTFGLGAVHRLVGLFQKCLPLFGVFGEKSDPDARSKNGLSPSQNDDGVGQSADQPRGDPCREFPAITGVEQNKKFVSSQAMSPMS